MQSQSGNRFARSRGATAGGLADHLRRAGLAWIVAGFGLLVFSAEAAPEKQGVAATVHPLATQAALDAMHHGGNAVDAAVAAALTLGVVDGQNSGIGGGCFMLIRSADGSMAALDGRETAPAAANRDMYLQNGKADLRLSQHGALAVGVPGSLAVYDFALRRFGKRPLKEHLLAAALVAERGFPVSRTYAERLAAVAEDFRSFPEARVIFFDGNGTPLQTGDILRQTDLAHTYRALAQKGVDWFYRGPFAQRTETWMKEHGGVLTAHDFAAYQMKQPAPIQTTYRGHQIVGFPPPSSGGVHVAQILNILEPFDLKALGNNSADFVHVVSEAMKLAFADRAYWLGDPDFVPVPRGLVAKEYGARLAKRIRLDRAVSGLRHGNPDQAKTDVFGKHTTHFSTADGEGNWVACTATVNLSFGSKVVVPGTGVVLNNQMDDFSLQPGQPNAFGLVGAEANAVAPGKRPLSSMSPTLVLQDDQPILAVGAAGGPTIISQTLLALVRVMDFGLPVQAALDQPRFHHQWNPDVLRIEKTLAEKIGPELERRGHRLEVVECFGATQAVGWNAQKEEFTGAADPRGEGMAGRFP